MNLTYVRDICFALNVGCVFIDQMPITKAFNAAIAAWLLVLLIREAMTEEEESE